MFFIIVDKGCIKIDTFLYQIWETYDYLSGMKYIFTWSSISKGDGTQGIKWYTHG